MSLESRIMNDLKAAMKAKDQAALRALRAVKAAIQLAKTDGSGKPIDEAREIQILQQLVKQRKESLETYEKNERPDLAAKEREELEIIEKYLPAQLNDSELEDILKKIIEEVGAQSPKDLGRVMGVAVKRLAGQADGRRISEAARKLLS
ncbi:MAG: GatB/YqeY domain-containing protein [Bacteroidetes bacterium]|nr:MAG: GatB/YqeY domain-containing protein [Bacteroidota bacterium]